MLRSYNVLQGEGEGSAPWCPCFICYIAHSLYGSTLVDTALHGIWEWPGDEAIRNQINWKPGFIASVVCNYVRFFVVVEGQETVPIQT